MAFGFRRSGLFSHDLEHPRHYLVERNGGVDFVPGASAQQWLDGLQQVQCPCDVFRRGSVGIVRPGRQSLHDDVGGCTEQDDVVEPRVELALVVNRLLSPLAASGTISLRAVHVPPGPTSTRILSAYAIAR